MMNKNAIKGILFDLDGTLFDSEYYQWQGWVEPLRKYGIELTKEMYLKYAGKNSKDAIDREMIEDFKLDIPIGALWEEKRKLIGKWFNEKPMPLLPYAKEVVEFFVNNPKFKVVLSSGNDIDEIEAKLKLNDFNKYFPIIVCGSDVKNSKPAPDIYIEGAKRLGLLPEECLAIEDTQYGLESAKAAGLSCFVVPNEYSVKQDFSRADKICGSLKDVIDYFTNDE
jgi:beta-phosphoglucomutase-like phosphatase (HAD superfamily)